MPTGDTMCPIHGFVPCKCEEQAVALSLGAEMQQRYQAGINSWSKAEKQLLLHFLGSLADRYADDSCNDMERPEEILEPDWIALVRDADAADANQMVEEECDTTAEQCAHNGVLLNYLISKLEGEK